MCKTRLLVHFIVVLHLLFALSVSSVVFAASSLPTNLLTARVGPPTVYHGGDDWVDSGITVQSGQTFTVRAEGRLDLWPTCQRDKFVYEIPEFDCSAMLIGPDGVLSEAASDFHLIPEGYAAGLIARIGTGQPFVVGDGQDEGGISIIFTAGATGSLQFRINDPDWYIWDDVGAFVIFVSTG